MPLFAISADGQRFPAWAMPADEWRALKASYRDLGLRAGCCDALVQPVTSSLGLQFFRHAAHSSCERHESVEHVVCKTIVAGAAAALGVEVTTEAAGPDRAWVADVLIRHPSGWRVAIEIQLSRIPLAEVEERQWRYRADDVRGAWLLGYGLGDVEHSKDLPLFRVFPRRQGLLQPTVSVPRRAPLIPLAEFVGRLLTKRVRFLEPAPHTQELSVVGVRSRCWRCHQDLDIVVGMRNVTGHPELCSAGLLPVRLIGHVPEIWSFYRAALPKLLKACPDLAILRPPRPGSPSTEFRMHCPICDAPITTRSLPKSAYDGEAQRCWTLAGMTWTPREHFASHWGWDP